MPVVEQAEQAELIEAKSPLDRFKEGWAQQPGSIPFIRQREFILQNPDLVQYAGLTGPKGWAQPLIFALQGMLLAALLISALSWWATHDRGWYTDQIAAVHEETESQMKIEQGAIDACNFELAQIRSSRNSLGFNVAGVRNLSREDATFRLNTMIQEALKQQQDYQYQGEVKMQNLRAAGDATALAASGTPMVLSLALLFAAPVFRRFMRNSYTRYRLTALADHYYLYYAVSHGILLNCALLVALNLFFSRSAYGLAGFFDGIGPIGRILFWLGLYGALLYWFFLMSKSMYKAMQLPKPITYLGLENKVLVHIHNSFWVVFAVFECALALLATAVYLLEKAK